METIAKEVAEAEINGWLDYKKIGNAKRDANTSNINTLVDAVCDGTLVVLPDKSIKHTLKFATDGDAPVTELVYKPRVAVREINKAMTGVKADDNDARLIGYVAAVTGKAKGIIGGLDSVDMSIATSIALFFV